MEIDVARKIFSAMPDTVFDAWLRRLITINGWPFTSVSDSTAGTKWFQMLHEQPIDTIAKLQWDRKAIPVEAMRFHPVSKHVIDGLTNCHLRGHDNIFNDMRGSKATYHSLYKTCAITRQIPSPPILMLQQSEHLILDGNHRIAAFTALPTEWKLTLDAWIGT